MYRWDAPQGPANVDAFAAWSGQPIEIASAYAPNHAWQELHAWGAARTYRELFGNE